MEKKRNHAWSCYGIAWRKMLMFTKLFGILLFVVYMFLPARGIAQEGVASKKEKSKVLQGWVYDKNHQVLPGVTVKVAGTSVRNFHERERLVQDNLTHTTGYFGVFFYRF